MDDREENKSIRQLTTTSGLIDFCSNDYLGLARSKALFKCIEGKVKDIQGAMNGSTGSRLLSGNSSYTQEVEGRLAEIFKSEAALLFNAGYSANLAVMSCLPQKGDTILYDELSHACIKDGARLSLAKRHSFKHNDLQDLERKLIKAEGNVFVVVESIYSMDGDACPLREVVELSKRYGANLLVDEAHSTGIMGERGSGMAVNMGLEADFTARVYTFGKAMGIHGACVAGSKTVIDYLINYARPFIYTTAPPPHSVAAVDGAFSFLRANGHLQQKVQEVVSYFTQSFDQLLAPLGYKRVVSQSAVQAVMVPGITQAKAMAQKLNLAGYDVRAILSPTVKAGEERLRVCLHAYNTQDEINGLIATIKQIKI